MLVQAGSGLSFGNLTVDIASDNLEQHNHR